MSLHHTASFANDYRIDVGSANKGRTFVRVVHLPTGTEVSQVGLGNLSVKTVQDRLIAYLVKILSDSQSVNDSVK